MDDEISKLVNKGYGPRPSSVTQVPSDDQLRRLLVRVESSQTLGLSWDRTVYAKLAERLEGLGFKLRDGNECWHWNGGKAKNGKRPKFEGRQAYLFTIAALDDEPYATSPDFDVDHGCGNALCVRPGLGHAGANLRSVHEAASKPDGTRPKASPKPKA